jgi:ubiquinone/menaquinone biosynthesis C-methylase UbiE
VRFPDYSPFAKEYAQTRPRYPSELFSYLASLMDRRTLAWDCATGNGQAAQELAGYFERVIATDISTEQLRHSVPHPHITYCVANAEQSGLDGQSVDLVTVATALHWFDLDRFYSEACRVVRPGGVLAAWTYHVGHVEPPFNEVMGRFYRDVVSPYFAPGARLVDDRYEGIALPGEAVDVGEYCASAAWNLDQMLTFIEYWSGSQQYMKVRGENPVALIANELAQVWGERDRVHTVRWPLYLRLSRL